MTIETRVVTGGTTERYGVPKTLCIQIEEVSLKCLFMVKQKIVDR